MSTTAETEAGRASNVVGVTRLTPAQEGMLYHMLAEPDLQLHVTTIQFDLVGDIDLGLLHDAFSRVVEDVPTLRTTFHWADLPHPVQVTHTRLDYPFLVTSAPDDEPLPVLDLAGGPVHGIVATPVDDHVRVRWRHFDLLFDGWSLALLLDRLMTTYTQLAGGQPHAANPSPTVNAAVEAMHRPAPAADLEFWESRLGAIDVRPLPALGAVAHRGDFCDVATSLDKQATSRLSAFAAELGVSFNTVLQGVWSIVLSRMTGQGRAMFGQVTSGRDLDVPQMDDLVGVFVNTVPIVVEVDPTASLGGWLQDIQTRQAAAVRHQLPLAQLLAHLRSSGRELSLDSVLIFENYPHKAAPSVAGVDVSGVQVTERLPYPLSLFVIPGEELSCQLSYDRSVISDAQASDIVTRLTTLLRTIVEPPRPSVDTLLNADGAWCAQQQLRINATQRTWSSPETLTELLDASLEAHRNSIAVEDAQRSLTYGELDAEARSIQADLTGHGIAAGSIVAVLVSRSVLLESALLGILRAGGAYLPLDPDLPDARLVQLVNDARPDAVVTTPDLEPRLRAVQAPIVRVGHTGQRSAVVLPTAPVAPKEAAYVIFTSGSTGRPKAVINTHEAIVNRLQWMQDAFPIGPGDVILQKTPIGFDVSVWEFFWPLLAGARLVMAQPGGHKDPLYLADVIRRHRVTVLHFVPSMLSVFLQALEVTLPSLRYVFASGEALPSGLVANFAASIPGARLVNLYGPTEAAVDVSWYDCPRVALPADIPIGSPIANTLLYVVDETLRAAPTGTIGEILIGGANLARGYLDRPGLTASRFVPDPIGRPGTRAYRTGDLGCFDDNNLLHYRGRGDTQVKIRGIRIELGEIEATLLRHQLVEQCAVVVTGSEPSIAAYLKLRDPDGIAELRTYLTCELPEAMVPRWMIPLDTFPVTSNGKIDRRALPAPDPSVEPTGRRVPESPTELTVAAVWSDLLGTTITAADMDFFAAGGHSLLAARMVTELRRRLRATIGLDDVLRERTIFRLARFLETSAAPMTDTPGDTDLERVLQSVTVGQAGLYYLWRLDPGVSSYNIATTLQVSGQFNVVALEEALRAVCQHQPVLQSTFRVEGDIRSEANTQVQPGFMTVTAHGDAKARISEIAQAPFDLARGPLVRVGVVRESDESSFLVLVMHHIVSDGMSMAIFLEELAAAYLSVVAGERPSFPPLTATFADWASDEAALVSSDVGQTALDDLASALATVSAHGGSPRELAPTSQVAKVAVGAPLVEALTACAAAARTTPFTVLLSAWTATVAEATSQGDLVVAIPVGTRPNADFDRTIGYFVNLLPLPFRMNERLTHAGLVQMTERLVSTARRQTYLPLPIVVEKTAQKLGFPVPGLVDCAFSFEPHVPIPDTLAGLSIGVVPLDDRPIIGDSRFPRLLTLTQREDGEIAGIIESSVTGGPAAPHLAARFLDVLQEIIASPGSLLTHPDIPVADDFSF